MSRFLLVLGLAVGLAACDSSDNDDFDINDYTGTYTGTATATVPGQSLPSAPFTGTVATTSGNGVTMNFRATGQDGAVVALSLRGTYDANGATFTSINESAAAAVNVRVAANGRVSGTITVPNFFGQTLNLTASGSVTPSKIDLSLASATPPGTFTVVGTK